MQENKRKKNKQIIIIICFSFKERTKDRQRVQLILQNDDLDSISLKLSEDLKIGR